MGSSSEVLFIELPNTPGHNIFKGLASGKAKRRNGRNIGKLIPSEDSSLDGCIFCSATIQTII